MPSTLGRFPVNRVVPGVLPAAALPTLAYLGAPWWVIVLIALVAVLAAAFVRVVDRVLPRDSPDLRGWWDDVWRYWALRHTPLRSQLPPEPATVRQRRPVDGSTPPPRDPPGQHSSVR